MLFIVVSTKSQKALNVFLTIETERNIEATCWVNYKVIQNDRWFSDIKWRRLSIIAFLRCSFIPGNVDTWGYITWSSTSFLNLVFRKSVCLNSSCGWDSLKNDLFEPPQNWPSTTFSYKGRVALEFFPFESCFSHFWKSAGFMLTVLPTFETHFRKSWKS